MSIAPKKRALIARMVVVSSFPDVKPRSWDWIAATKPAYVFISITTCSQGNREKRAYCDTEGIKTADKSLILFFVRRWDFLDFGITLVL
jgi:hypothetical protein